MTANQIRLFWHVFNTACQELGYFSNDEKTEYRRKVLREEAHCEHLREVRNTTGVDSIMARLWVDAGDFSQACNYRLGDIKREAAMAEDCCRQVLELSGNPANELDYIRGILKQAGIQQPVSTIDGQWFMDIPQVTPFKVFCALDTQRRRLIKKLRKHLKNDDIPLGYRYGATWQYNGGPGVAPVYGMDFASGPSETVYIAPVNRLCRA